jgi:hypothetical protein
MAWVETEGHGFVARHESEDPESASAILASLAEARERVEGVLGRPAGDELTVVIHGSEWALNLAEPWLPVIRLLTAPAARRYMAGWVGAGEMHVLTPRLLAKRASNVPGSREMLLLVPAALYARLAIGTANRRLAPPFTPGATIRYLRWAWLVEGVAQWLSGQTAHVRPAVTRRLHEGDRPAFPPSRRDAALLGGTVIDLLAREEGAGAVTRLVTKLHPQGADAALVAAFGGRPLPDTERAWRASLSR